jgi:hypothetical protein
MEILQRGSPIDRQSSLAKFLSALVTVAACLMWPSLLTAQDPARVTYTKVLKGSIPESLAITVDANGEATYEGRRLNEPSSPRLFQLAPATWQRIFQLAEALRNFESIDLESHKKVANLGLKTFIYEGHGERHQAQFNYTQRREAQELMDLFEKIASVQQHITVLEHAIKYDPLSLPQELLLIQIDLDRRALVDPELMVPALEKIAHNPRFLHLAQVRAQNILQRLQGNN